MKHVVNGLAIALAGLLASQVTHAVGPSWQSYFGSQGNAAGWAGTIRGFGRNQTGLDLLDDTGRMELEKLETLKRRVGELDDGIDVVVPVGGLGSGGEGDRTAKYKKIIGRDNAQVWKDLVSRQVLELEKARKPNTQVYWQIGNEITSKKFAKAIAMLEGDQSTGVSTNLVIRVYVEKFLAPTVNAIQEANAQGIAHNANAKVVLGTIGNAGSDARIGFLERLLNYQIEGSYARALAGKRVHEVVDVIAVHYIVTKDDDKWPRSLDRIGTWLGKGRIKSIFATEELGIKRARAGRGAETGLRTALRYLSYWQEKGYTPDTWRCMFYAWSVGPAGARAADGLSMLQEVMSDAHEFSVHAISGAPLEIYRVTVGKDAGRETTIFVFGDIHADRNNTKMVSIPDSLTGMELQGVHIFSTTGHRKAMPKLVRGDGAAQIHLENERLPAGPAAMIVRLAPQAN